MSGVNSVSNSVLCPAIFISAPASGQGKTTVTAALARLHRQQGRRVIVFKTGPDFLDPTILERASGNPVYQLDMWMGGEAHCRELLYNAAQKADLILIEGVMGLFDGAPSSAELAMLFNIPVLAVINAASMAQTFGALAHGLANYNKNLLFAGVIANRVASANHAEMIAESLPKGMRYYGALPRDQNIELPSRHLGLVTADEVNDLEKRINLAAKKLLDTGLDMLPDVVVFTSLEAGSTRIDNRPLSGHKISIAQDQAFSFIYRANIECLESLGAKISYFSPINDNSLPESDSVYFPGGYPELHLKSLSNNHSMIKSIKQHHTQNKPIIAECGGMLYLLESLTDTAGNKANMAGLLTGTAVMQQKLTNLGMHSMTLPEGEIRGHTFHHSTMETAMQPITTTSSTRKKGRGEAVYRSQRLHASYLHMYFPSNPNACARLFKHD
ncbi:Cobyrinic acid a,c-diamide synthetase [hydrothermal vent metagenome]|uniref:Cobyrinic acid a,c-diamide synthetase n=1 Tax=hydrothermal vent metagenome TaxID=652676 RepID=A0A3B1A2D9_9ZZZZ